MTNEPINEFLDTLKTDIIHSLQANGKMATGQTAQQITVEVDDNHAQLQLPAYLELLEKGRGPTSPNAQTDNSPMIDRIKQWCQAKGIPDKAAWAIKKSIDKNGFKGIPGLLSKPLSDENINLRLNAAAAEIADVIVQRIVD